MNFAGDYADFDTLGFNPDHIVAPRSLASLIAAQEEREAEAKAQENAAEATQEEAEEEAEEPQIGAPPPAQISAFDLQPQAMMPTISGSHSAFGASTGMSLDLNAGLSSFKSSPDLWSNNAFGGGGIPKRTVEIMSRDLDKIKEMRAHLQTAISLEQKTIPLYLYAAYSIKNPGPAMWNILRNILCSIGGYPGLYRNPAVQKGEQFVPEYPTSLLYQEIRLNLRAANKGNIRTFMELERPDPTVIPAGQSIVMPSKDLFDDYGSIGAFYYAISQGQGHIYSDKDQSKKLFIKANIAKQLNSQDGSWYDDDMISVEDIDSALQAIATIVEQGEGSPKVITPEPPKGSLDPPAIAGVRSHFEVFEGLYNGPKVDCYDVLENPKTKDYIDDPMYPVLLASDAVYCYLLLTLEKLWTEDDPKRRRQFITKNLQHLMMDIMRPMAKLLVTKVVTRSRNPVDIEKHLNQKHFGPPFNFYDFYNAPAGVAPFQQLKNLMAEAVAAAPELKQAQDTVNGLMDIGPLNPVRAAKKG
ncbi:hypothetical protein HWV62_9051 [Athelia sp. TMB]|nr:hypothetical protein HWV62_9051 [Athelia sp. TMB]